MLNRGITFEIPNEYGNWLGKILESLDMALFNWLVGEDTQILSGNGEEWGSEAIVKLDGFTLKKWLSQSDLYVLFADFKAFPLGEPVRDIASYEEFQSSRCEFVLLIVDSIYLTIYVKNPQLLQALHRTACENQVQNLAYIHDENDERTRLSVW